MSVRCQNQVERRLCHSLNFIVFATSTRAQIRFVPEYLPKWCWNVRKSTSVLFQLKITFLFGRLFCSFSLSLSLHLLFSHSIYMVHLSQLQFRSRHIFYSALPLKIDYTKLPWLGITVCSHVFNIVCAFAPHPHYLRLQ